MKEILEGYLKGFVLVWNIDNFGYESTEVLKIENEYILKEGTDYYKKFFGEISGIFNIDIILQNAMYGKYQYYMIVESPFDLFDEFKNKNVK